MLHAIAPNQELGVLCVDQDVVDPRLFGCGNRDVPGQMQHAIERQPDRRRDAGHALAGVRERRGAGIGGRERHRVVTAID